MNKFSFQNIRVKDVLISVLILVVTFGYFFDDYISEGITEINILGITISSFGFVDISDMIYFTKMKFIIIFFSIIWYFTCRHWWKSAILAIITIELLKLFSALNSNQSHVDEIEFYSSLPLTVPIILIIIFIAKRINDYNLNENLRYELDNNINEIFFELHKEKKEDVKNLKKCFVELKETKKTAKDEYDYLGDLIEMRDNFYKN